MFKFFALVSCLLVTLVASSEDDAGWHHGWSGKYKFEYGVKDPHTGDHKSQWEQSNGPHGGITGGYTLDEADGTKRVVQYKADKWHGFQAIVKRIGHAIHPQNYGVPFVVRRDQNPGQKQGYQQQQDLDSYGQSFNGVGFWKLPSQQSQQNSGWVDQQTSSSNNAISSSKDNGWKNGAQQFATSYANQKNYH